MNNWEEIKLGNICEFKKGKGLFKKEILEKGKNECIHYGELFTKYNTKINSILSFTNKDKKECFLSEENDVLMPTSDVTPRGLSTSSCIMKKGVIIGGDILVIRTNKSKKLNGLFFSYYIKARKKDVIRLVSGTTVFHLYRSDMDGFKFLLPPFPEQNHIVEVLETWDTYLEKLSEKIEIKKRIKKGLMQKLLNHKVRAKGFNNKWEKVKLSDICGRVRTGKLDANAMVKNGKYRFYTCAKEYFKIDNYDFDTEALLISGNGANVGYIHYYKGKFNAYQRTYVLDKFKSNIFFTKYVLDNFLKRRIYLEKCEGNTPYIKKNTLVDMIIEIPRIKEQEFIANIINNADEEIKILEEKKRVIGDQKKYLLNNLVTGKIRIPAK